MVTSSQNGSVLHWMLRKLYNLYFHGDVLLGATFHYLSLQRNKFFFIKVKKNSQKDLCSNIYMRPNSQMKGGKWNHFSPFLLCSQDLYQVGSCSHNIKRLAFYRWMNYRWKTMEEISWLVKSEQFIELFARRQTICISTDHISLILADYYKYFVTKNHLCLGRFLQ